MTASRRQFLAAALATPIAATLAAKTVAAEAANAAGGAPRFKKAVKFGMIQSKGSIQEKLELVKSLGFLGVEMDSPSDINRDEAVAAQKATGVKIHGVIDSVQMPGRHRASRAGPRHSIARCFACPG